MKGPAGYGRYDDDVDHVGCPRAPSSETPCVARDGASAVADDMMCVGCYAGPAALLQALRDELDMVRGGRVRESHEAADKLAELVRATTRPRP